MHIPFSYLCCKKIAILVNRNMSLTPFNFFVSVYAFFIAGKAGSDTLAIRNRKTWYCGLAILKSCLLNRNVKHPLKPSVAFPSVIIVGYDFVTWKVMRQRTPLAACKTPKSFCVNDSSLVHYIFVGALY